MKQSNYHLVHTRYRSVLGKIKYVPQEVKSQIRKEFSMRVKFSKKHYKGKYDKGHWHFMGNLSRHLKTTDKMKMSLDDCILINKLKKNN